MERLKVKRIFLTVFVCLISSCETGNVEYKYPQKIKGKYEMVTAREADQINDTVFDKKYLTLDLNTPTEKKEQTKQHIEKSEKKDVFVSEIRPLWTHVLPILSRYPISEMHQDSFITTEWFSDSENPLRQLKINAVKIGENAQITVLCRQKNKNGEWINQKNDATLADKIKNDIVSLSLNN